MTGYLNHSTADLIVLFSIIRLHSSKAVFLCGPFFVNCVCLCHTYMSVSCSLLVSCWERADLLALLYVMLLVFCNFPIFCPGSGVVLDCIDS